MKNTFQMLPIALMIFVMVAPITSIAQDTIKHPNTTIFELGVGPTYSTGSGSFGLKMALQVMRDKWGGAARFCFMEGKEGKTEKFSIIKTSLGDDYRPAENFNEKALLATRELYLDQTIRVHCSGGVGLVTGEKLNENTNELYKIGNYIGFAYGVGLNTMYHTVGFSISIAGNLNKQVNLLGIYASITLGDQK